MGVFTTSKQFALEIDMPGWWLAGSSVDMDFVHGRYFDNSLSAPAAIGNLLSISRASIGYAKTSAGTLTQFSSGQLRITDLGLLVEDARTNYLNYSEDFSQSGSQNWTIANAVTFTANQAVAPNGTNTMMKISEDASTAAHYVNQNKNFFNATTPGVANGPFAYSVFVKDNDRRYVRITLLENNTATRFYCIVDLQTGTITGSGVQAPGTGTVFTGATIESFANGAYRISVNGVFTSTRTDVSLYAALALAQSGTATADQIGESYLGTNKSVFAWGAQLEQLSAFASSYIPTTTTSATRAADAVTITGAANTAIQGSAGSELIQIGPLSDTAQNYGLIVRSGPGSSWLRVDAPNAVDHWNNSADLKGFFGGGMTWLNNIIKSGFAWDGAGRSIVGGGGTVATDAGSVGSTGTSFLAGSGYVSSGELFAYFRRLTLWNFRLADATLQAFTNP